MLRNIMTLTVIVVVLSACATQSTSLDMGDSSPVESEFQWPVYGAVMTQKFRPVRHHPYRRIHEGIDLAAAKGTLIHAIDHGRVVYVGHGKSGYGRLVILEHLNKEYRSYYAHLSTYNVKLGDIVKKGDPLGRMGRSGRATGVHLHFEVHRNQVAIDPLDTLPTPAVAGKQASP